jgi:catalase
VNSSSKGIGWVAGGVAFLIAGVLCAAGALRSGTADDRDKSQQVFDATVQDPGTKPGHRVPHAKAIVCEGTFEPSARAAILSKAADFQVGSVPLTIRFLDGPADPVVPDNSNNAGPRGIAVRSTLAGGGLTDVKRLSHNGFAVGKGEEFLALLEAAVASNSTGPQHRRPLKFARDTVIVPASFGTRGVAL